MQYDKTTENMFFTPEEWALLGEQPNNDPAQRVKHKDQALIILIGFIRKQDRGYLEYGAALEDGTATKEMQQYHQRDAQAYRELGEEIIQDVLGLPPDTGEYNPLEAPFTPGPGPARLIRPDEGPLDNPN